MRNNEERFGPPLMEDNSSAATVHADETPQVGLNFVSPTEFVDLPSGGKFYPEGHPLHGKDSIEIKFMTAKEEDILTSKSLLKKGVAIDRMLQNLIVDKSIKLEHLLSGDKNAILLAARMSGYGAEYSVRVSCPSCEEKQDFSFDLSSLEHKDLSDIDDLSLEHTQRGTFVYSLPRTKAKVEFRLLTSGDESQMTQEMLRAKKEETTSTDQLKRVIVSVNGVEDRLQLKQFVESMPAADARFLRAAIRRSTPDVNMSQDFVCASCSHEEEMEVPLTTEFFWPK
jgi:hypothetical protein